MGKETSEATRRMVRLAQGNLCGFQLLKGLAGSASARRESSAIHGCVAVLVAGHQAERTYGCCSKLILEQGEPYDCGKSIFRNEVLMSAGGNAEAMEPNAYHNAKDLNNDDDASLYGHRDSSKVELRMDIEVSRIIGTETKIVKQVSSWRSARVTWVRLKPNTADELSWDRAKARSLACGIAIYLVLNRLDIAFDIEELIERIGHERVAENLNNAGMNSTNSEVNSEEPKCVWTVLC